MGIKIERKYLTINQNWRNDADKGTVIQQGYLNSHSERTVRVRIKGKKGFITIKGKSENASRLEYEYEIPLQDAIEMMDLCEQPIIEKIRYLYNYKNQLWEIDVFDGDNLGLTVAEIELKHEDEEVHLPEWVGQEVTSEKKYFNSKLTKHPYKDW